MLTLLKTLSDPATLKALASPFSPALSRVVLISVGILIGIFSVYGNLPLVGLKWQNAEFVHLTEGWKDIWVKNAALAAELGVPDEQTADTLESAGYGPDEVGALADANASTDLETPLRNVQPLPNPDEAASARSQVSSSVISNITPFICVFLWFMLLTLLGIVLSFRPIPVGKWRKGAVVGHESTAALGEKEQQRRQAMAAAKEHDAGFDASPLGDPVASFMSAYVLGDDLYDDSFAIEPEGMFAGECGIEISETIGVGDPKKVTAFEVWMFDQNEIQTLTYVVMSEHAYNDQSLRDKLAPRGEAVLAQAGQPIILDTKTLTLQVRIIDLEYGEGSLPPNSFFGKLTFALAAWQKDGAEGGAPAAMPTPMPMPIDDDVPPPPPPPSPSGPPPTPLTGAPPPPSPSPGGATPLTSNAPGGGAPPPSPSPSGPTPLTSNAPG
ncbi:MAG TPA: hypothetical protein VKN35_13335, partial [Xanthomonadales bacterium]|nr:hypothetical protein [Xanthomonadales bacterium]